MSRTKKPHQSNPNQTQYQNKLLYTLSPKNLHQEEYLKLIDEYPVVFAVGPAGSGKSKCAVYKAAEALQSRKIQKIILSRPILESGEKIGHLPGTLMEKVHPYMSPLYEALYEVFGKARTELLMESGTIEVCPLAYLRGKNFENAFVILDEAQNTTCSQMKLILTRLCEGSKIVVNGDLEQSDLPRYVRSGLQDAYETFEDSEYIQFIEFDLNDVVRSKVVHHILQQYQSYQKFLENNPE